MKNLDWTGTQDNLKARGNTYQITTFEDGRIWCIVPGNTWFCDSVKQAKGWAKKLHDNYDYNARGVL